MISASQIYDFVHCPHRVLMDEVGVANERDETSPFVELLWEQGLVHENAIADALPITANLKSIALADREQGTLAAMARHEPLIYGGRLTSGDLIGEPDLMEWNGVGYTPGDIKSGSGFEGDENDGKFKKHYAFQLAHYVFILEQLALAQPDRAPCIIDRHGNRVSYQLMEPQGVRNTTTWWDAYHEALAEIRAILTQKKESKPALSSVCGLCHWRSSCKKSLESEGDLTLIAELGRSSRDKISGVIPSIQAFADSDPNKYVQGSKTVFSGIGPGSLFKFHSRAQLLSTPGAAPYLKQAITLPVNRNEVFFDIEADPMHDFVYLHGFVAREHGRRETATFVAHFAAGIEDAHEEEAFRGAWIYLTARATDSTIYYYSKYERTEYKKLASKYPGVCSVRDVEDLFALPVMIDLYYNVIKSSTEWPLYDQSIKSIAKYLGFQWRDANPSGAASIEWYNRWIETNDGSIKQRILDYNEDDCLATGVVVDGIQSLPIKI